MDFYIIINGQRQGPFPLEQLPSHGLRPDSLVWQPGFAAWTRADQVPAVNELLKTLPPPASPTASIVPSVHQFLKSADTGRPWSPIAIAGLGLVFSPVWTGIMAALNSRRLHLTTSIWRPVGIGLGSLALALLLDLCIQSYLINVLLYLGAIGLIAYLDLLPQKVPYQQLAEKESSRKKWLFPALAGSPLALLVFWTFVVVPLLPLEPREVCERFKGATTEKEMKKYTTNNVRPALPAWVKMMEKSSSTNFEWTEEGPLPPEVGGYMVGFREVSQTGRQSIQLVGFYHLVERQGGWKIEDMYITTVNRQELQSPFALSVDYQQLPTASSLDQVKPTDSAAGKTAQATKLDPKKQEQLQRNAIRGIPAVLAIIVAVIGAIASGIGALWKKITGGQESTTV